MIDSTASSGECSIGGRFARLAVDGRQRFDSRTDGIRIGVDPVPQRVLGRFFLRRRIHGGGGILSPYLDTGRVDVRALMLLTLAGIWLKPWAKCRCCVAAKWE